MTATLVALTAASGVSAQLLSPGSLAKPHSSLEGLNNCLKCHEPGNKLSDSRCLACHKEISKRVGASRGLHTRVKSTACAKCHREHRGKSAKLINWGAGGRDGFDHGRTGWARKGAHAKASCKKCHDSRRLRDVDAKKIAKKRKTFLGLSTRCASCHFDEHRGQLGERCEKCHVQKSFAPAPAFDHKDTAFKLTGRHRRVKCKSCHDSLTDQKTAKSAFPAPASVTFAQYSDVTHNNCVDCHRDEHRGQMGRRCSRCHSTRGWKTLNKAAKDTGFHDKSAFPLRGSHISVACKTCHGPFRGKKAIFKGLPHGKCSDCHTDAHGGQLEAAAGTRGPDCKRCHSVRSFTPATFTLSQHEKARFVLDGGHRAVPCARCHKNARRAAALTRENKAWLKKRGRAALTSRIQLKLPKASERCESCHRDPHAGQLDDKVAASGCNACHQSSSFRDLRFDHARDSRFPLTGAHAQTACASCHRADSALKGAVRYRSLPTDCAGCHSDVHAGQFADAQGVAAQRGAATACARCHATSGFQATKFAHDDPAFSSFPLKGRHREIACASCHPATEVAPGVTAAWYRGVPTRCAGCHVDQHDGRFSGFEP